jgi:hypothetical protein
MIVMANDEQTNTFLNPSDLTLEERQFAEKLIWLWNDASALPHICQDKTWEVASAAIRTMLLGLGAVWDVHHGWVFPWS